MLHFASTIVSYYVLMVLHKTHAADPRDAYLSNNANHDGGNYGDDIFATLPNLETMDLNSNSNHWHLYDILDSNLYYSNQPQYQSNWPQSDLNNIHEYRQPSEVYSSDRLGHFGGYNDPNVGSTSYTEWQPHLAEQDDSSSARVTITENNTEGPGQGDNDITLTHIKPGKTAAERTSEYWRNLKDDKLKRKMTKRYKEITGNSMSDEQRRFRLRTRCDPSIQADLLAGNDDAGDRAVRNLDFQQGVEKVFSGIEKIKLMEIMEQRLNIHSSHANTILSYGIAGLPDSVKEYYGRYGIRGDDEMYVQIAKDLREIYGQRHRMEAANLNGRVTPPQQHSFQ